MVKNPPTKAGAAGEVVLTPGSGISLGGGKDNPFHGVASCNCILWSHRESDTT